MPLTMAKSGEISFIKKVGGNDKTKRFLENLGFVVGENIIIISENCGNIIVNVKESRIAISREMANRIMI